MEQNMAIYIGASENICARGINRVFGINVENMVHG